MPDLVNINIEQIDGRQLRYADALSVKIVEK